MDCQEYQVGRFVLQPFRQLLDGECPVSIRRKALELLSVLAGARGALVTKDELMAAVWPNAVVEDNALQVHIASLRKLLFADARLLSTVHGFGYRLAATPLTARLQGQIGIQSVIVSRAAGCWRSEKPPLAGRERTIRVSPPASEARRFRRVRSANPDDGKSMGYAQTIRLAQTCSERAILRLAELTQSGDDRVALLACQALLDRAIRKTRGPADPPSAEGAAAENQLRGLVAVLVAEFGGEVTDNAVDGSRGSVIAQAPAGRPRQNG